MMKKQIVGLGHAVTDLIAKTSIGLVADFGLEYGGMKLINHDEANHILKTFPRMKKHMEVPANTLYHLGTLGHSVEFVCGIGDDRFGHDFARFLTLLASVLIQHAFNPIVQVTFQSFV